METWPSSLQQYLNEESFSFSPRSSVEVSEMDVGPAKKRRRMTKQIGDYGVSITLKNQTDVNTLLDFFDLDLNGGVEQFSFVDPITGLTKNFRMSEPKITPMGGTAFLCSMQWESMP